MNRSRHAAHTARRERGRAVASSASASCGPPRRTELLGDAVEITDGYRGWWSYVPHFIATPGYVYAYAYGQLLALSVYGRYREEGEALRPALPRAAGRGRLAAARRSLAAIAGLDLADPGFWADGLTLVARAARRRRGGRRGRAGRARAPGRAGLGRRAGRRGRRAPRRRTRRAARRSAMCAERSRTSSRAPGTAPAIASEAAGGQMRSWRAGQDEHRPADDLASAASTSGTAIAPVAAAPARRARSGGGHRVEQVADARVARVGEVERQLVGQERRDVLRRAGLGLAPPTSPAPARAGPRARSAASSSSTPASQRAEGAPQETTVPACAGSGRPTGCDRATKAPKEWPSTT